MNTAKLKLALDDIISGLTHLRDALEESTPASASAPKAEAVVAGVTPTEGTPEKKAPAKRGRPAKSPAKATAKKEEEDESEEEGEEETSAIDVSKMRAQASEEEDENEEDTDDLAGIGEEEEDDLAEVEEKPAPVTSETLRSMLVEYAQKHSKDKAYAVLAKFGAKKVADLKPESYAKVQAALK